MSESTPSALPDFGTLRELLHRPPSHRAWLDVLEFLHAAKRHDEVLYTEQLFPYARSVLQNQWPRELLRLSAKESRFYGRKDREHLLPLAHQGVTLEGVGEWSAHVEHLPEIFVSRVDLHCQTSAQFDDVKRLLGQAQRVRGIHSDHILDVHRGYIEALVEVDQPYLSRLQLHAPSDPELWKALLAQTERMDRITHLELHVGKSQHEVVEALASAPLAALDTFGIHGNENKTSTPSEHWIARLPGAPWLAHVRHLSLGGYSARHDATLWHELMQAVEGASRLRSLQLWGWRLDEAQMSRLCEFVAQSKLEMLRIEDMGLDPAQRHTLFSTPMPETLGVLHLRGERWEPAQLVELAALPGMRHVRLDLNEGHLNRLAALAARPHLAQTLYLPRLGELPLITGMEAWRHVEHLIMGEHTDDDVLEMLRATAPANLRRIDVSRVRYRMSVGTWQALASDPHYGVDAVRFDGDMDPWITALHEQVEGVKRGRSTSLRIPEARYGEAVLWVCEQPWIDRITHLDVDAAMREETLEAIESAWERGGFSKLETMDIRYLQIPVIAQFDFARSRFASEVDITIESSRHDARAWLAGEGDRLEVEMEDVRCGALDFAVERADSLATRCLSIHDWRGPRVEVAQLEPIAMLPDLEEFGLRYVDIDLVAMTRWLLAHCPKLRVLVLDVGYQEKEIADAMLAIEGITRLDEVRMHTSDFFYFKDAFEKLKAKRS